jgi:hypothetical protein
MSLEAFRALGEAADHCELGLSRRGRAWNSTQGVR